MQDKDNHNSLINIDLPHPIPTNKVEIDAIVADVFDYKDTSIKEDVLISRGGSPVVARGEITVLTGPRKTFKSHLCAILAASSVGGDSEKCLGLKATGPMRVIYIDTEQSAASFAKLCYSIATVCDGQSDNTSFIPYLWRGLTAELRTQALVEAVSHYHPDIVIIDGVADLVENINDNTESAALVSTLLRLVDNYKCGLVTAIHMNPSSSKERGHLGTILGNKTYGYLGLKRSGNIVTVSSMSSSRGKAVGEFMIEYDEELRTIVEVGRNIPSGAIDSGNMKEHKVSKQLNKEKTKQMAEYIPSLFSSSKPELSYTEISDSLCEYFNIDDDNKNEAERAIGYARKNNIIRKGEGGRTAKYMLFDDLPC